MEYVDNENQLTLIENAVTKIQVPTLIEQINNFLQHPLLSHIKEDFQTSLNNLIKMQKTSLEKLNDKESKDFNRKVNIKALQEFFKEGQDKKHIERIEIINQNIFELFKSEFLDYTEKNELNRITDILYENNFTTQDYNNFIKTLEQFKKIELNRKISLIEMHNLDKNDKKIQKKLKILSEEIKLARDYEDLKELDIKIDDIFQQIKSN